MKRYYSLDVGGRVADIDIYGDISFWPWKDSDVSAYNLSVQLAQLDVDEINVNINSYGGEVAEGLAIYNALKRHRAKINTRCDGFACSIASVVFMAGDRRIMNEASLLMIHNAWTCASGDASDLRKSADDLDLITAQSKTVYLSRVNISEEELDRLMDAETFIDAKAAIDMGFATEKENSESDKPTQCAQKLICQALTDDEKPSEPGDDPGIEIDDPDEDEDLGEEDGNNAGSDGDSDGSSDAESDDDSGDEPEKAESEEDEKDDSGPDTDKDDTTNQYASFFLMLS